MGNPPFESMYFLWERVDFHCQVFYKTGGYVRHTFLALQTPPPHNRSHKKWVEKVWIPWTQHQKKTVATKLRKPRRLLQITFFFSAVASSEKKKKEKKNKPKTSSEASFWQPLLVHHQEPHLHLPQKKHGRGGVP